MVIAELFRPRWKALAQFAQHVQARIELHMVALTIVKGHGFHTFVAGQGIGQAGRGVLASGKQNKGGGVHRLDLRAGLGIAACA